MLFCPVCRFHRESDGLSTVDRPLVFAWTSSSTAARFMPKLSATPVGTIGEAAAPSTTMKNPTCKNCYARLTAPAEPDAGQWIMRCFECGAKNILVVAPRRRRLPVLSIAGWRE